MSYHDRPFPLFPNEINLNILEKTDLITPIHVVTWNPIDGYRLPLTSKQERGSWQPPGGLFLVSKAFYVQARFVFFKNNRIVVWPHGAAFTVRSLKGSHTEYAGTTFFANILTPGTFQFLRYLEFPALSAIGPKAGKETKEQAQKNWVLALQRLYENGGVDNLWFLRITGSWDDAPNPDNFLSRTLSPGTDLVTIRNFVKDRIWPFIDPEDGPPRLPRNLVVEMQGRGINRSVYSIRGKEERRYKRADGLLDSGPAMSRFISWKPLSRYDGQGRWVEDARQDGEQIEEAWLEPRATKQDKSNRP